MESDTTGHVLVIDDEESLRLTFETFLRRAGYGPVEGVSSFDAAIAAVEKHDYDLIISDIVLEGASGIDILRRVKELGRKCPVVMVTGYPNIETAAEAVRLGAFDYVPKPVKKDALLDIAARAIEQRRLHKRQERLDAQREKDRYSQGAILRSVREIIITVAPDLRVVDMNDMALEWGKTCLPGLVIGVHLPALHHDLAKEILKDVQSVQRERHYIREHRIEWRTTAATDRMEEVSRTSEMAQERPAGGILSVTASPLQDGQGAFLGVVVTARDLTHLDDPIQRPDRQSHFHRLIGRSEVMARVYSLIRNVGRVDTTVLITGESGTGKELVAEALHEESRRATGSLVKVDCAAIPDNLLESELFGHRKGSFTGADRDRTGRILQANGGTLFLDEIGDISTTMQLRLLRFLQERSFYPVGRDQPVQVDVRVIAATNADLKTKVQREQFREDLYFRLRVVDVMLPPLREREGDIALLVGHFLALFAKKFNKEISGFSDQALERLLAYHWPGNVRELQHTVERAFVLCPGNTITTDHLSAEIVRGDSCPPSAGPEQLLPSVNSSLSVPTEADETARIIQAVRQSGGNKAKAARLLGIDRSTLYRKITCLDIDPALLE